MQVQQNHQYAAGVALDGQSVVYIVVGECSGRAVPYGLYENTYFGWASPDVRPGKPYSSSGNGPLQDEHGQLRVGSGNEFLEDVHSDLRSGDGDACSVDGHYED